MADSKLFLTPEETYKLAIAALDVVGSVSPGVLTRCRRSGKTGVPTSNPGIKAASLVALADQLDELIPGVIARLYKEGP